jgi:hypothetical protein
MIDAEAFERNFVAHHKNELDNLGIDLVRLRSSTDVSKYRAIELLTRPLNEENVSLGYLRSHQVAKKYQLSLAAENFGRGEGETDLKRSFSIKICEYRGSDDDEKILETAKRLKSAEEEFYRD